MQPHGIYWENLNVKPLNKFFRLVTQVFLLTVVMIISVIIILVLFVAQDSIYRSEYRDLSEEAALEIGTKEALQSYCLNLSISQFR